MSTEPPSLSTWFNAWNHEFGNLVLSGLRETIIMPQIYEAKEELVC